MSKCAIEQRAVSFLVFCLVALRLDSTALSDGRALEKGFVQSDDRSLLDVMSDGIVRSEQVSAETASNIETLVNIDRLILTGSSHTFLLYRHWDCISGIRRDSLNLNAGQDRDSLMRAIGRTEGLLGLTFHPDFISALESGCVPVAGRFVTFDIKVLRLCLENQLKKNDLSDITNDVKTSDAVFLSPRSVAISESNVGLVVKCNEMSYVISKSNLHQTVSEGRLAYVVTCLVYKGMSIICIMPSTIAGAGRVFCFAKDGSALRWQAPVWGGNDRAMGMPEMQGSNIAYIAYSRSNVVVYGVSSRGMYIEVFSCSDGSCIGRMSTCFWYGDKSFFASQN
jgi:hypothetical protein